MNERNPWITLFDNIQHSDGVQLCNHGLFPHWVYECCDPEQTVRIRRHAVFCASRDAIKYERLKIGLASYRLVFGQINQEDLLDTLQQQALGLDRDAKDAKLRRLASYMLNLSPIRHE